MPMGLGKNNGGNRRPRFGEELPNWMTKGKSINNEPTASAPLGPEVFSNWLLASLLNGVELAKFITTQKHPDFNKDKFLSYLHDEKIYLLSLKTVVDMADFHNDNKYIIGDESLLQKIVDLNVVIMENEGKPSDIAMLADYPKLNVMLATKISQYISKKFRFDVLTEIAANGNDKKTIYNICRAIVKAHGTFRWSDVESFNLENNIHVKEFYTTFIDEICESKNE